MNPVRSFKTLAVAAAATLITAVAAPGALAQPGIPAPASGSLSQVGACISDKKALDLIIMIDETGSLIHEVSGGQIHEDRPGADVEHNRVPAAQSFVEELLSKQSDEGFRTTVRIAGFGQTYKSGATDPENYGEWTELSEATVADTKAEIQAFTERTDEQYTNYAAAIDGAYQDFSRSASGDACRMLVTFTDGALTAAEGADAAEQALCAPGGVSDRLRSAGVSHIGIGLSAPQNPSDFGLLQSITEGAGTCGELPPNGAFFTADNVGGLFAAFREALATGGEAMGETGAGEPFTFTLDNSVNSVRFTAIAKDDLGPAAHLVLTAPNGETVELRESGSGSLNSAEVGWEAESTPVQMADGTLALPEGGDWAGVWQLQFQNFDSGAVDSRVFNSVEIQPDLQLRFGAGENPAEGGVNLRDDQQLQLQLVDRDGNPRALEGQARLELSFTRADNAETQVLAEDLDLSSGQAEVALDAITDLPALGSLNARTTITTAGADGNPGTSLSPILSATSFSLTQRDMPQLPGGIHFEATEETLSVDVPVNGPGRVWLPEGSQLQGTLPEGMSITAGSEYNSVDNALVLGEDESTTFPVDLSLSELRDGLVNGSLPLQIANPEGANEATVAVPTEGSVSVPINTTTFLAALISALLLALLIPLLVLYAVRFFTAKIPREAFAAVRIPLEYKDGLLTYEGRNQPDLNSRTTAQNQVNISEGQFHADGYQVQVKSFQLNPFAEPVAVVEHVPSISGEGKQDQGRAKLPLVVQGSWFLAARSGEPAQLELVAFPYLPSDPGQLNELTHDITHYAPNLAEQLLEELDDVPAQPGDANPGAPGGGDTPAQPGTEYPQPNFGGGFGSGGPNGPTPGGGFGSGGPGGGFGSGGPGGPNPGGGFGSPRTP
ncbi:hypothetical protein COCCU_12250 [Corynebacterium occultum]|uniref:VWFA domain-containing protein n=1 Tax=Corynebacterium occultum TaxID=2675219 RepID=A0A6B8WED2_9CORY|nr:vWA domain-containing protein [Corynebacterium occultum]QGU08350.1 hypothetical protein COCCU_12250 [Corynebacterium occultum]